MSDQPIHADFRTGGFVSLWLGNRFTDEAELEDYIRGEFRSDFGFAIDGSDAPECDVNRTPKKIADLVHGFSRSETFLDSVVELADLMGWAEATTAVVFYNFKYDSDFDRSTEESSMRFIGVVRYPGFA